YRISLDTKSFDYYEGDIASFWQNGNFYIDDINFLRHWGFVDPSGSGFALQDLAQAMGADISWDANEGLTTLSMIGKSAEYRVGDGKTFLNQDGNVYINDATILAEWGISGSEANRVKAVTYALRYSAGDWVNKADKVLNGKNNPAYEFYGSNCTNFVSQALAYGGLSQDITWWYKGSRPLRNSAAWEAAPDLIKYLDKKKHFGVSYVPIGGDIADVIGSVQPGDVVGFDLNAEGGINHAGIVTKIEDGKIFYGGNTASYKYQELTNYPTQLNYDLYFVHVRY
ncbi:MAG: amidase domain-containing protein, partial [Peptococcaceae bacterium]|nr:amidase domain-containing protein [Peptococcaceae bacterium]